MTRKNGFKIFDKSARGEQENGHSVSTEERVGVSDSEGNSELDPSESYNAFRVYHSNDITRYIGVPANPLGMRHYIFVDGSETTESFGLYQHDEQQTGDEENSLDVWTGISSFDDIS